MTQQPSEWARPSPTIRVGVLGLCAAFLLALSLALAPRAEAFIYWANDTGTIGRANLDGTNPNPGFISGASSLGSVAVDAEHVYWMVGSDPTDCCDVARADLDGTGVDKDFIIGAGGEIAQVGAVDPNHIYWSRNCCHGIPREHAIGRANLDGSGVDAAFMSGFEGSVEDVAVDANYIYWAQWPDDLVEPGSTPIGAVGRAKLDGSAIDPDFISLPFVSPRGVAVDAAHIYWINTGPQDSSPDTIGRADLDGTGVNPRFIADFDPYANALRDLAVDDEHVYWTDHTAGIIGRANLDGSGADDDFIDVGRGAPGSLAVDALTDTRLAGKASAARTQRQAGERVVVRVKVRAEERLTAKASGKIKLNPAYKLKPKKIELTTDETKTLRLKPKKAKAEQIARALKRGQPATAKLSVKLSDLAANSETEKLRVRLKR